VVGDLSEDCEDMDRMSPILEEFLRVLPDAAEPDDLSLREKRRCPCYRIVLCYLLVVRGFA
jgi:hypothetical protein